MKITVVIIFSGRQELLERCIDSVLRALPIGAELKIVVNGAFPESIDWLSKQRPPVSWTQVPKTSRCITRNNALAETESDLVYFLDDDVVVPEHLFALATKSFEADPELAILGGPNLTPLGSSFLEKCFGAVVTSPFCAPKVRRRYARWNDQGPRPADQHDLILCNFVVRRNLVWPRLRFTPNITSNEENIFVFQGQQLGLKICRLAELYVYHVRRSSLRSFLRQIKSYGMGRGEQMLLHPQSNHHLFFLALIFPPLAFLTLAFVPDQWMIFGPLYFLFSAMGALLSRETRELGWRGIFTVTLLTPMVHLTYSAAMWSVLVRYAIRRLQNLVFNPVASS